MQARSIVLEAVGHVRTEVPDAEIGRRRRELQSWIDIDPAYVDGLTGIEAYSHLFVIFWMHRREGQPALLASPRGDPALPAVGAFAARGRNHPNALGLAVVELLARDGNRLRVTRLDAYDGTPVLDIKPYDDYDQVAAPRVPDWFAVRARGGHG